MSAPIPALAAGLGAASIWGGMYVVSKVVLGVVPPFALLSLRLLLGFAALAAVVLLRGGFRADRRAAGRAFAVGFVGYGVSLGFQFVGTKLSTASAASLITAATPALVLPFALLLLKERLGARKLFSVAVATAGVLAVVAPWSSAAGSAPDAAAGGAAWVGNLCLILAALTWALYSVLVRRIAAGIEIVELSALMLLGGLPTCLGLGAWELATVGAGPFGAGIVAGILFLGIVSTAGAMFLWNYAFAVLPASTASLTFFAQPVVGALLGWATLGERITPLFLVGGACIAAAIFLSRDA